MFFNPTYLKAKLLRGMSDSSRLSILESLRSGAKTVKELGELTGLSQSNISNHLACLRDCGLVHSEQKGRFTYYSVADARIAEILEITDALLSDLAKDLYECTRGPEMPEETPAAAAAAVGARGAGAVGGSAAGAARGSAAGAAGGAARGSAGSAARSAAAAARGSASGSAGKKRSRSR